jgi:hypothetical protein
LHNHCCMNKLYKKSAPHKLVLPKNRSKSLCRVGLDCIRIGRISTISLNSNRRRRRHAGRVNKSFFVGWVLA